MVREIKAENGSTCLEWFDEESKTWRDVETIKEKDQFKYCRECGDTNEDIKYGGTCSNCGTEA